VCIEQSLNNRADVLRVQSDNISVQSPDENYDYLTHYVICKNTNIRSVTAKFQFNWQYGSNPSWLTNH